MGNDTYPATHSWCKTCSQSREGSSLAFYLTKETNEPAGANCFECGYNHPTISEEEYYSDVEEETVAEVVDNTNQSDLVTGGIYAPLTKRGISQATCEAVGYQAAKYTGGFSRMKPYSGYYNAQEDWVQVENWRDESGNNIVGQKLRTQTVEPENNKLFKWVGKNPNLLYGQWNLQPNPEQFLIVTEGVIDMMSAIEILGHKAKVVSLPDGAGQGKSKVLKANMQWLLGWKYVIFCFDEDKAGNAMREEVIELFDITHIRFTKLPANDINELLMQGKRDVFKDCIYKASMPQVEGIVEFSDLLSKILERPKVGLSTPWDPMTRASCGFRGGDVWLIGAASGIGKSEISQEMIMHHLHRGECIGYLDYEHDCGETGRKLIGKILNKRLQDPTQMWWNEDRIKTEAVSLLENKLHFIESENISNMNMLESRIKYLAKAKQVKVVYIDNLMCISGLLGINLKEPMEAMARIKGLTKSLNIDIVMVSHVAKDKIQSVSGKEARSWDRGRVPSIDNLYGGQAIPGICSNVFVCSRDTLADDDKKFITKVTCLKSRALGEYVGSWFELMYNVNTGRYDLLNKPEATLDDDDES